MAAMANLVSTDPSLHVLELTLEERWTEPDEFLKIRETQIDEIHHGCHV